MTAGVLEGDDRGHVVRQPHDGVGREGTSGTARYVVEHHRQVRRRGNRAEVGFEAGLGRLVVVGDDGEDRVDSGRRCGLRHLDAVRGVVCSGPGDDRHVDGAADDSEQFDPFLVGEDGALSSRTGDDDAVIAVLDQPAGQFCGRLGVERAVGGERRHHRGENRSESWHQRVCGAADMGATLPRARSGPAR